MKPDVGIIYLARKAEGLEAFRRFARSYQTHSAGIPHELVILYKGFQQESELTSARKIFSSLPHLSVELADDGFDIGAYVHASRRLAHTYLAYLNTHSEILSPGWLAGLHSHVSREGVGIAGASGSYESIRDTVALLKAVLWRCVGVRADFDPRLAHYYDFVLKLHHPEWYASNGAICAVKPTKRGFSDRVAAAIERALQFPRFRSSGTRLIWPGASSFDSALFPGFPNPHIRSNGFMMRRHDFLRFAPGVVRQKVDTSLFESGPDSLTARIRRTGLGAAIVDRNGRAHDVQDWHESRTFRLGDQSGLIVGDNHTRAFEQMSEGGRFTHAYLSWGEFIGPPPADFPMCGFSFARAPL